MPINRKFNQHLTLSLTFFVSIGFLAACKQVKPPLIVPDTHDTKSTNSELKNQDWPAYLGSKESSQYSSLAQINTENVADLELAWTYRTGDVWEDKDGWGRGQIQTNALVIDGIAYGASPAVSVFALKADNGEELWRFDPTTIDAVEQEAKSLGNCRGFTYWENGDDKRLFFANGHYLYSLDAKTGKQKLNFGKQGRVDLRVGLDRNPDEIYVGATSPGVIYKNLLIQGTRVSEGPGGAPGYVRAYDVHTGEIKWTFHTIPHKGEFGYDTWPEDAYKRVGGANSWTGMSLDEKAGVVFIPTGSAAFDFWGGDRHGQNLFANSLIAVNAENGKRIWHFQTVHHDIWDRDLPAPPNLLTLNINGKKVEAVAQITKSGHVFVFNRSNGEPLFPIEEIPVPGSSLEGEQTWPTQPIPVLPKAFTRQKMTASDVNDHDAVEHKKLLERFNNTVSNGQFQPFDENGTIIFPGFDGGAEWGGAATDPQGILYVNANEMPWIASLTKVEHDKDKVKSLDGQSLYLKNCASCHGEDKQGDKQNAYPALTNLADRTTQENFLTLLKTGRGFMPAFNQLSEVEHQLIAAYLFETEFNSELVSGKTKSSEEPGEKAGTEILYEFDGYHRFTDSAGNPAIKPPWGTLNAIDLNTGEQLWQVPLGEFPELSAKGIPPTGAENYGGPIVTAGGVIFIGATRDEMFRAFDKRNGKILWQTKLPVGAYATPSTYMVNGVQYVIIAAGGGKMGTPTGDYYLAFRLKKKN